MLIKKNCVCIIFWFFPCIVSRLFCFSAIHYSSHLCSLFFIAYISPHLSPFWWLFSCFSHLLLSFSSPALNLGAPIPIEHLSYRTKPRKTLGHSLTLPPDLTLTFLSVRFRILERHKRWKPMGTTEPVTETIPYVCIMLYVKIIRTGYNCSLKILNIRGYLTVSSRGWSKSYGLLKCPGESRPILCAQAHNSLED